MHSTLSVLILLVVLWLSGGPARALVGINVDPPRREFILGPGASLTDAIAVTNQGDKHSSFAVTVMDLALTKSGEAVFHPGGTRPCGAGAWIRVNPAAFELAPGDTQLVRFTAVVSQAVAGSYVAVIFFQTRPEQLRTTGAMLSARMGSVLVLHVAGQELKKGEIVGMAMAPYRRGKPFEMALTFKNAGNWLLRPQGKVRLKDGSGAVLGEVDVNAEEGPVLPGDEREFRMQWVGQLAPGSYTMEAILDYGGEELLVGEAHLTVPQR